MIPPHDTGEHADTITAEPELCRVYHEDFNAPQHAPHNVHELGEMVAYLATKNTGGNRQLPPGRYSPDVMDFIGATLNTTAVDLCGVSLHLLTDKNTC